MNANEWPWVLSNVGKKVLRPGGREMTMKLLDGLNINSSDQVVEFAPGIGFTAEQVLKRHPKSYTGIEINEEAGARLQQIIQGDNSKIIIEHAAKAGMENGSVDKVLGEAMLTMHVDNRKSEIIAEAARLLKKGGLYAIHELSLAKDNIRPEEKAAISKDLSNHSHVNTRPLTKSEWKAIVEKEGFRVIAVYESPMLLLEASRVIHDEGLLNMLSFAFKVMRKSKVRKKIFEMRKLFKKHRNDIRAIGIVAEKL